MAALAFIGLFRRSALAESTEKRIKKQGKLIERGFVETIHNVSVVLHK
jgi:hypothetical protein